MKKFFDNSALWALLNLFRRGVFTLSIVLLGLSQTYVFLLIPTDFNGDPNDYINVARQIFSSDSENVSILRFVGYPFFIKAMSLNLINLNLVFFAQSLLFVSASWYFAKSASSNPYFQSAIVLIGTIPSIAYMQKLLFPDGLILTACLLFLGALIRKNWKLALLFSVTLILVKVVFVFTLLILVASFFLKDQSGRKVATVYISTNLALVPAIFLFQPFFLYFPIVQEAPFAASSHQSKERLTSFTIVCDGDQHTISGQSNMDLVYEFAGLPDQRPLSGELILAHRCTSQDLKNVQRTMAVEALQREPSLQVRKYLEKITGAVFTVAQTNHLDYMLYMKSFLSQGESSPNERYAESEIQAFESQGIEPLELLVSGDFKIDQTFQKVTIAAKGLLAGIAFAFLLWQLVSKKKLSFLQRTLLMMWFSIAFVNSTFAFTYDRYLQLIPFLCVAFLASQFPLSKVALKSHGK
ncbi:MAG: hypothetical protein F2599_04105 [Actinobacteria bacterium]|uniref:Unannotated protein n=1 Tax=freshwater metagenome TaxID=449393 RepID=A0A6J6IHV0_9ZZZZ|nr:hypothetical protein [Actinomycetota bacterium]